MGDFNLSCIDWHFENGHCKPLSYEGRMSIELINTMICSNLLQFNHIKNQYGRTLDLILSNNTEIECKRTSGIVNEDAYHPAIEYNIDSSRIHFMKLKRRNKFNFYKADYNLINSSIESIDWKSLFHNLSIDDAVSSFYSAIQKIIDIHTPVTRQNPNLFPIWYSKDLIRLINEKEEYYKLKKKTQNPNIIALYEEKRKECRRLQRKCFHDYEVNIEAKIKDNPKSFFAYTKSLRKTNFLPPIMKFKDQTSSNVKDTSKPFAIYFSSVYTNPNSDTPMNHCRNFTLFPIQ